LAVVDLDPGTAPAVAWRELLLAGWPVVEIHAAGADSKISTLASPRTRRHEPGGVSSPQGGRRTRPQPARYRLAARDGSCAFGVRLLLVGNTELSLLDNAQVVYDMAGMSRLLGASCRRRRQRLDRGERERGQPNALLLTPISRAGLVTGKMGGLVIAWVLMFLIAVPYLWAVGSTGQNLVAAILGVALFGTPVVLTSACSRWSRRTTSARLDQVSSRR